MDEGRGRVRHADLLRLSEGPKWVDRHVSQTAGRGRNISALANLPLLIAALLRYVTHNVIFKAVFERGRFRAQG